MTSNIDHILARRGDNPLAFSVVHESQQLVVRSCLREQILPSLQQAMKAGFDGMISRAELLPLRSEEISALCGNGITSKAVFRALVD